MIRMNMDDTIIFEESKRFANELKKFIEEISKELDKKEK